MTPVKTRPWPAQRLALYYIAIFTAVGFHLPFWPVWLKAKGLEASDIGIILSLGVAAKVIGNPLVAHLADRSGERKRLIVWFALATLATFALYPLMEGFWALAWLTLVVSVVFAPQMPLIETLTLMTARDRGLDYGRIRLWGSIAFIAASMGIGRLLVGRDADLIFWLLIAAFAATVAAAWWLPDTRAPRNEGRASLPQLLTDRRFLLFLLVTSLIQGSHGVYYGFATLHWRSVGISEDIIGLLWAEGVVAEIILFVFGAWLIHRFGAVGLIAMGGAAGLLRWGVTGATDALPALIAVQGLHAFTFGSAHLGAIHFIGRYVAPTLSASAQSVYAAAATGIGIGVSMAASGWLYERFQGQAFWVMAAMGLVGFALALALMRITPRADQA